MTLQVFCFRLLLLLRCCPYWLQVRFQHCLPSHSQARLKAWNCILYYGSSFPHPSSTSNVSLFICLYMTMCVGLITLLDNGVQILHVYMSIPNNGMCEIADQNNNLFHSLNSL